MIKKINIREFFSTARNQYYLGLLITLLVTLAEVAKWKQRNFFIYRYATLDMWDGKIPYGREWAQSIGFDSFLYGPLFSLIFSPFAFLPPWLGPFFWNILNYSVFFYAIRSLPVLSDKKKTNFFFFILLMMANNLMYYQYNMIVASIFLIGLTLMEKGNFLGSIMLIGISGFTKIYGVFQYAFLVFYKHFWRNILIIIPVLLVLGLLPLIMMHPAHLLSAYTKWVASFPAHFQSREWMSLFHFKMLFSKVPESTTFYQLGSFGILSLLSLLRLKRSSSFSFRAASVGIMMGWVILFSNSPEIGTYLIAMCGLALWYFSQENNRFEQWLLIFNFFLFMIVPQDILFPRPLMRIIIEQVQLHILVFTLTWLWMIWKTYGPEKKS